MTENATPAADIARIDAQVADDLRFLAEIIATAKRLNWRFDWNRLGAVGDHLRRARFHERENYDRWKTATASHGGDGPCQVCGRHYPPWFAPHAVWNLVMGGPDAKDDPGGLLCPTCFVGHAEENGHSAIWALTEHRVISPVEPERGS